MAELEKRLLERCSNEDCPKHNNCDLCMFETGVKSFAKFLIDKGIDGFEISDLVIEFLEKGK